MDVLVNNETFYSKQKHSLLYDGVIFPSARTFIPLLVIFLFPVMAEIVGLGTEQAAGTASSRAMTIMAMLLFGGLFAETLVKGIGIRIGHGIKDLIIHMVILFMFASPGFELGYGTNLFIVYMAMHVFAHSIDFHLRNSGNRFIYLFLAVGIMGFVLLAIGHGMGITSESII